MTASDRQTPLYMHALAAMRERGRSRHMRDSETPPPITKIAMARITKIVWPVLGMRTIYPLFPHSGRGQGRGLIPGVRKNANAEHRTSNAQRRMKRKR